MDISKQDIIDAIVARFTIGVESKQAATSDQYDHLRTWTQGGDLPPGAVPHG